MKTQIRLNSVVPNGVSGPEAGAIDVIYGFLLTEFKQDFYTYISINQIDEDFDEVIIKNGKKFSINVKYESSADFDLKDDNEKNRIRLEVVHQGLLRIAEYDKKFDLSALQAIKSKILERNFSFNFVCKNYSNSKNTSLNATVLVNPNSKEFIYSVFIQHDYEVKCYLPIYKGGTSLHYFADLFKFGKWEEDNLFVLTGEKKNVDIRIFFDECRVEYKNLTPYDKAPFFQMFRNDITAEEKNKAREDFIHSLPPAIAAIIRKADN